ncbi:hypothetical protein HZC21_05245 [Candidatus Peregrinibacteria bacterium]|nr:hypothetical protein [Candidatus Peregrinibacteria bacterium]
MPLESEKQSDEDQNLEELRTQYRNLVEKSAILNEKDKKAMMDFLNSEEGKNPDTLKKMIEHFSEAEKSADKINKEYNAQIQKEIAEGRFAKKSAEAYEKWFKDLSFKEKAEAIKAKSTDLHDPKRQKLLDAFNGKTEFFGVFIPAKVRNEFREKFFNSDLEEREALLKQIAAQHKKLKENFLALPKEVQERYREKFKELGLADREKLLKSISAKKNEPSPEKVQAGKIESQRLEREFDAKINRMVQENLFSPLSVTVYQKWFKGLGLDDRRRALKHSDLDNPERVRVRDEFYRLPPETQKKYDLRFRNANLDKRKTLLNTVKQEESQPEQKTSWIRNFLRRLLLSSGRSDIKEKVETYAITNEIAERRHRFRLNSHTREESAQKAQAKGLAETAEQSRKLSEATELSTLQEAEGGIKVKLDTFEHHAEARHKWKRMLKPKIDDPNAKLSADITLRTKSGDEVIDERAYQRGELQRELDAVKKTVKPIITAEAAIHGIHIDDKQIQEELKKTKWDKYGKEVIKKAA